MAEKINATCAICGKGYHMCMSCKDMINLTPWKKHTDTSEHYKIYQIIHGYSTHVYTKAEAKTKFKKVDLSDLDTFRDNIKSVIAEIMGVDDSAAPAKNTDKKTTSIRRTRTTVKHNTDTVKPAVDSDNEVVSEQ